LPAVVFGLLCLVWGYNWVVMKQALAYASPFDFAAWRTLPAALLLFGVMLARGQSTAPPAGGALILLGLLQTAGFIGLATWALVEGGAGKTSVLAYTMPFWTLVLAWPALGERLARRQMLAAGIALAGLVLVIEPWQLGGKLTSSLLALGAGISWAASAVLAKWLRARRRIDLLSLTAWQMLVGATVLTAVAVALPAPPVRWTAEFVLMLLYNIVPATAGAWLAWLYLLHRLSASAAGLSVLAVPVVGVLSSRLQLGEQPDAVEMGGMLLIAAGLVMLNLDRPAGHRD
jgi:drug/metabolite transporter (DMT)-like permease